MQSNTYGYRARMPLSTCWLLSLIHILRQLIERHGGLFLTQSNSASIDELVREIDGRRSHEAQAQSQTALTDVPGWWTLAVAILLAGWLVMAWRLKR